MRGLSGFKVNKHINSFECAKFVTEIQLFSFVLLNYRFSAHNVLGIRQFADSLSCTQLVTAAEKYIDHYFAKVSQSEEFLSLSE